MYILLYCLSQDTSMHILFPEHFLVQYLGKSMRFLMLNL